jgi:protein-tyrosine phosphatase
MASDTSHVLFLCTGNYYRSRFAEHLFNHLAPKYQLPWRAFSRGLATELVADDAGPISPFALYGLALRGIPLEGQIRSPIQLTEEDLAAARHIVALKRAEHLCLLRRAFPAWAERVEFWHVHDIDVATPDDTLPHIEEAIRDLLKRLSVGLQGRRPNG